MPWTNGFIRYNHNNLNKAFDQFTWDKSGRVAENSSYWTRHFEAIVKIFNKQYWNSTEKKPDSYW